MQIKKVNPVRNKTPKTSADAQAQRISNGVKVRVPATTANLGAEFIPNRSPKAD